MGNSKSKTEKLSDFLDDEREEEVALTASNLSENLTAVAVKVTGAAAGFVAGPIGKTLVTGLWSLVFPPVEVSPVMPDIEGAVKQALTEDAIAHINGTLHDLRDKLSKDYADVKRYSDLTRKTDRQDLLRMLTILNDRLDGAIGLLKQREYAEIGLMPFMLLAGFRLALYQEMANVDPDNEDPGLNPAKSRYAVPHTGLIARYAEDYAYHAEEYWQKGLDNRKEMITVTPFKDDGGGRIEDQATEGWVQTRDESINTFAARYWKTQKKIFEKKFANPEKTIANWRKLIAMPINVTVGE